MIKEALISGLVTISCIVGADALTINYFDERAGQVRSGERDEVYLVNDLTWRPNDKIYRPDERTGRVQLIMRKDSLVPDMVWRPREEIYGFYPETGNVVKKARKDFLLHFVD